MAIILQSKIFLRKGDCNGKTHYWNWTGIDIYYTIAGGRVLYVISCFRWNSWVPWNWKKSKYTKDFSWGFYCTNNFEQA